MRSRPRRGQSTAAYKHGTWNPASGPAGGWLRVLQVETPSLESWVHSILQGGAA